MSAKHGWSLFVAVMVGIAAWMVFFERHSALPPELAALELARGDISETGSCFSLGSVVKANRLEDGASDASVYWNERVHDEWTLHVKRGSSRSAYTFLKEDGRMVPVRVVFMDDLPQLNTEQAVDELLKATANGSVPRVARCGGD